jgi:TP901 family phage tail tape measure protein
MEFEQSMSAVGAATQATAGTLSQLRDAAMKAGADTKYSATEAADGITEMAKAGVSAKDIMGGGLTGALSLAAAGQIDVAEAAGIASTAMTSSVSRARICRTSPTCWPLAPARRWARSTTSVRR